MLNSGKKITLCATTTKNILTLVLFEKKILNETKNHNSPLQVKWSVPNGQSREIGNTRRRQTKQTHNTININKTWALLQTTGGKD
jgi:hypothetical protein